MKATSLFLVLTIAAVALAGCTGNNSTPTNNTTTSSTPPASSTPPVSSTPAVSTPTISTPVISTPIVPTTPVTPGNAITSVYVLSAPVNLAAPGDANICWRVGGKGEVAHTAIHWDTVSHPNSTAFGDYVGGAAYADEASKTLSAHLAIPAAWCVNVPVNTTIYYRAHAFQGVQSVLSAEKSITVGAQTVDFTGYFPQIATENSTVNLCWSATETGTAKHTAYHYDYTSHPNSTNFADYVGGARYNESDSLSPSLKASLTLPGSWCAHLNITQPTGAVYYLRAHVVQNVSGTETSVLGPERTIVVGPATGVTNGLPMSAPANSNVLVCWRAEGAEHVIHTAVHWDTESHANEPNVAFSTYNGGAPSYPDNQTQAASAGYQLPGPFCSNLKMPASGTIFFVTHVLNPAMGRNEISHEYSIQVS